MNLLEELRNYFVTIKEGARRIKSLPDEYPAYVIKLFDGYGVAIEYSSDTPIFEHFANSYIRTCTFTINEIEREYLILICELDSLKYEFASICAEFIDPGFNGERRKNLVENPLNWWNNWKMLLGNSIMNKEIYSILSELIVFEHLIDTDPSVEWTAINGGTHDFESRNNSYEVKATLKKYESNIVISGQHQLHSDKPLFLYFCRLEESEYGISINDKLHDLQQKGNYNQKIELYLERLNLQNGSSIRNKKYMVLEKRKYIIDSNFPKITNESFKNNTIPESITKISYTVDLSNIEYIDW